MTSPTLLGQRVILKPMTESMIPLLARWFSDPEILPLVGEVKPLTREAIERWYTEAIADQNSVRFTVTVAYSQRVIGYIGLLRMFRPWQSADMLVIIGEKDMWGQGYGTDAGHRLLKYAFDELGFHRLEIRVVGFNTRALRFWTGLGFQQEGIARESYYCNGQYSDFILMGLLEDEYRQKRDSAS